MTEEEALAESVRYGKQARQFHIEAKDEERDKIREEWMEFKKQFTNNTDLYRSIVYVYWAAYDIRNVKENADYS